MYISNGAMLWSTLGSKSTKGDYSIIILRGETICMVPMALWMKEGYNYLLGHFYGGIYILSWW